MCLCCARMLLNSQSKGSVSDTSMEGRRRGKVLKTATKPFQHFKIIIFLLLALKSCLLQIGIDHVCTHLQVQILCARV